ncbi:grasp-with-spasm system SPASM domain peptide maturase [Neolewinella persica]|uniref:grasp-with-spasm system SPASM domain peptide maturase n=1 Tax=Neolewinella persica TaxID=70998 RepID=UPI00035C6855|nr:grasp-with-spasm system SPASM domain peptide maturase [Neolewinella persica]
MSVQPTYLLYASCVPVSGAKRKIICDLQRNGYVPIPDGLYEILTRHRGKSHKDIKAAYENKYDQIIDDYFKMLVQHEFAFACTDPNLFPELSLDWKAPFPVFNAILDRDNNSAYDLRSAVSQLSGINCKYLQLRFFDPIDGAALTELLQYFETIRSATIGLEVLVPAAPGFTSTDARKLLSTFDRLNKITLHGSPGEFSIEEVRNKRFLISMPTSVDSEAHCGIIDPELFSINIKAFTEAKKFNSCLNGKISVDRKGFIRNCPSMQEDFGHLDDTSLAEASSHPDFRARWQMTKDEVNVCRDCEFRYICTDCRAYTQDNEADGKPLKCGYDPYTGEWASTAPSNRLRTRVRAQKTASSSPA